MLGLFEARALPTCVSGRGVDVGVVTVLESSDKRVLLTRRAAGGRVARAAQTPVGAARPRRDPPRPRARVPLRRCLSTRPCQSSGGDWVIFICHCSSNFKEEL